MAVDSDGNDKAVKFKDVALEECLETLLGTEALRYACPSCHKAVLADRYGEVSTARESLQLDVNRQEDPICILAVCSRCPRQKIPARELGADKTRFVISRD
jgi:hypothetical protein